MKVGVNTWTGVSEQHQIIAIANIIQPGIITHFVLRLARD